MNRKPKGPRSAKAMGIAVKTMKEFTTSDGMVFNHYSTALAHERSLQGEHKLIELIDRVLVPGNRALVYDFIISNRKELRSIL